MGMPFGLPQRRLQSIPVASQSWTDSGFDQLKCGPACLNRIRTELPRSRDELPGDITAVGPWWNTDNSIEIDAVALAGRSRVPVLLGEAKWAKSEDAGRLAQGLARKGAAVPGIPDDVRYAVCARESLTNVPPKTIAITARDVFSS